VPVIAAARDNRCWYPAPETGAAEADWPCAIKANSQIPSVKTANEISWRISRDPAVQQCDRQSPTPNEGRSIVAGTAHLSALGGPPSINRNVRTVSPSATLTQRSNEAQSGLADGEAHLPSTGARLAPQAMGAVTTAASPDRPRCRIRRRRGSSGRISPATP
jgi:hypothetical protein